MTNTLYEENLPSILAEARYTGRDLTEEDFLAAHETTRAGYDWEDMTILLTHCAAGECSFSINYDHTDTVTFHLHGTPTLTRSGHHTNPKAAARMVEEAVKDAVTKLKGT